MSRKFMLIAGEASGDLHASHLMNALSVHCNGAAEFVFMGGDNMRRIAQNDPLVHISDMAFMGFSEVFRNIGTIRKNFSIACNALVEQRPDALILIDYPSFNLKVAKTAKKLGIPVFYYVSPKVWAWKEHRVKAIKQLVEKLYVIFPFEVDFYRTRHDYEVEYVGNPTVDEIDRFLKTKMPYEDFLERNNLRNRPIIALLPGSRLGEIRNNLKIMVETIERFPQYRGVIGGAPGIDIGFYRQFTNLPVIYNNTFTLLSYSQAALVTSGTATLETALIGTPQVACYRSNGSRLAYKFMSKILKVPYVTLPNLIANEEVIPEMLLHECTPDNVTSKMIPLLRETPERTKQLDGYALIRRNLYVDGTAPENTAKDILNTLNNYH